VLWGEPDGVRLAALPDLITSEGSEMEISRRGETPILKVENLATSYETRRGTVDAVKDVSFEIYQGESFGIVGESGCGKSTVAYSIVNSLGRNGYIADGKIIFKGRDLVGRSEQELRALRGNDISMVFQDPMLALNPTLRIGTQLTEVLTVHSDMTMEEARERCTRILRRVYMPDTDLIMMRYPHQLSGGQQQRVIIAMALLNDPDLLIMDEPTTALDVTVEAAVLDLIDELRHAFDAAILYISHNLGVIAQVCDRVGVMYVGTIVENASVEDIFVEPAHPYTSALTRCVPRLGASKESSHLRPVPGRIPSPNDVPAGCLFAPRCECSGEACATDPPTLREVSPGHYVRCHSDRWQLSQLEGWEPPRQSDRSSVRWRADGLAALEVDYLRKYYEQESRSVMSLVGLGEKRYVQAVDGVSFRLPRGATLGIVGESGCGKSTLARTVVGLESVTDGSLMFLDVDITEPVEARDVDTIRELQMVFQNPDSTLNPSFSVGYQIARSLRQFKKPGERKLKEEVNRLLNAVYLDEGYYHRRPRQLSGGEKQRVAIARAIATHPELVLCDEPVTSLDVSVQAAILNLLLDLQEEYNISIVYISHDLSVVRYFSDYVAIMYLGQFVEFGPTERIYTPPYHPYTEALLAAVPIPDPAVAQEHIRLEGTVPSALNPPSGCRFHTRCPRRGLLPQGGKICEEKVPPMRDITDTHRILCHLPLEQLRAMKPIIRDLTSDANGVQDGQ
jgi:peptide/nickel transport system ATP-binding protein